MKPFTPAPLTYFYLSRPAPCPYITGRVEQMIFTELSRNGDADNLHDSLSRSGFRRSQGIAYKPACPGCESCIAVRVRINEFENRRSFRRIWAKSSHIRGRELPPAALSEHFDLFRRYIQSRHSHGGMAAMNFDDYAAMVQDTPVVTRLVEFRDHRHRLVAVCLTDILDDGLSLVYSYYDPDCGEFSPGTFIILWHIEQAKRRGLPYVYLGYWIENSPKMTYKTRFQPMEILGPDGWLAFPKSSLEK